MKKNDTFHIEITDQGSDGEGIGHYEGMTFFIKDTIIGDTVLARATKLKKNYGYARIEELIRPSEYRIKPLCPIWRRCGGCQIQAMAYPTQLEYKLQKVRQNLIRIGGFSEKQVDAVTEPPVGMDSPYRYRNKAQFPVGRDASGNIITGFYAARTHAIIPVDDCLLGAEVNQPILDIIKKWMQQYKVEPYDESTGRGLVRHVLIRVGFHTEEIMVCLIINGGKLPHTQELIAALRTIRGMTSISFNCNTENTNVILGKETVCVWGQEYITDEIALWELEDGDGKPDQKDEKDDFIQSQIDIHTGFPGFIRTDCKVTYHISPQSFYQVNPRQTEKLYSTALAYAGLTGREIVWDLYCGIGTISLFLAQRAKMVYGVEAVPQAIDDARSNARLNGIENAEFFVGKAEEVLPEFYRQYCQTDGGDDYTPHDCHSDAVDDKKNEDMAHPDVIVVDPPRKGCDEKCLQTMLRMAPARIVYVSCDSATLARDLKVLCEGGYEVKRVRVFDQFANTVHVETVCLLSKLHSRHHIEVELHMDEMDVTAAESKATYEEIKAYVLEHSGLNVSNLYIAQVKQKYGIIERECYNKPKSDNSRQPKCPPEKEAAIAEALKYFKMI